MVVVDYTATQLRNYLTTQTDWLAIGTSIAESIETTSVTIDEVVANIQKVSISYPTTKSYTNEYLLDANTANGSTLRRIALKNVSTTSQVITLSNVPSLDKNNLIEVSYEYTILINNE